MCTFKQLPKGLTSQVLRNFSFIHAPTRATPHNASYVWKSIRQTIDIIKQGLCFQIRDGCSVSLWSDPWLPNFPPHNKPTSIHNHLPQDHTLTVKDLILQNPPHWNTTKINNLLSPQTAEAIQQIHLPSQDKLIWSLSQTGDFSVFSAYNIIHTPALHNPLTSNDWIFFWKLKIHQRLKLLMWKIIWKCLPTISTLPFLNFEEESCFFCPDSCIETFEHLFLTCSSHHFQLFIVVSFDLIWMAKTTKFTKTPIMTHWPSQNK